MDPIMFCDAAAQAVAGVSLAFLPMVVLCTTVGILLVLGASALWANRYSGMEEALVVPSIEEALVVPSIEEALTSRWMEAAEEKEAAYAALAARGEAIKSSWMALEVDEQIRIAQAGRKAARAAAEWMAASIPQGGSMTAWSPRECADKEAALIASLSNRCEIDLDDTWTPQSVGAWLRARNGVQA